MSTDGNKSEEVLASGASDQTQAAPKRPLLARLGAFLTGWGPSDIQAEAQKSANELAADRTDLAASRTLMAADRSLMAWVRTSLSMISFGFTIYKILQGFQQSGGTLAHDYSPQTIGLFLTGLGTVSMAMGTIEYWQRIKELRKLMFIPTRRPAFVMAMIMSVTGLFFFVSIVTKLL